MIQDKQYFQLIMMNKVKKTLFKKVHFLGAAIWEGQPIEGVDKTPDLLRQCQLFNGLMKKYNVEINDLGNITAQNYKPQQHPNQAQINHHINNLPLLDNLLQQVNQRIITALAHNDNALMLTIGGDHSVGSATLHALQTHYKDLKVIWVDAHPDFIDPANSKYYGYHGYPCGHAFGLSHKLIPGFEWLTNIIPFQNLVFVGIRDIDPDEWITLKKHNIKCFTMDHVMQFGIGDVMRQAINYLDPVGDKPFHISFDVDAIQPIKCFGTGTKFRGGLRPIEANHIIRKVAHQRKLVGLDVVQINPSLQNQQFRAVFRAEQHYGLVSPTLGIGIDLIESVFTEYFTL